MTIITVSRLLDSRRRRLGFAAGHGHGIGIGIGIRIGTGIGIGIGIGGGNCCWGTGAYFERAFFNIFANVKK